MLHNIVKEARDGILPKVEPHTGDTAAAGSNPNASTERDTPATATSGPPSAPPLAPPLPSPLAAPQQKLQYSAIHSVY